MKLIYVHPYLEETEDGYHNAQQVDLYENISMIEFEDQTYLKNGKWIHITQEDGEVFSIGIDDEDWFRITE